jgi:protoheme IX farnesyltransferase
MLVYTIVLFAFCLATWPLHIMGPIFFGAAAIVGGWFLYDAIHVLRTDSKLLARGMFKFSLMYLALMCLAAVIDRVVFA